MSVAITVYLTDCIIMVADSRMCQKNLNNSVQYSVLSDDIQKLFLIKSNSVGVSVCGDAHLDGKSDEDFIEQFDMEIVEESDTVTDVAYKLFKYVQGKYIENIWFQVSGYYDGKRFVYSIHNDEIDAKIDSSCQDIVGAAWCGDTAALKALLEGENAVDINFANMSIHDGIEFAYFLAELTCKIHKFQTGTATCGGPIDILLITQECSKWICHKKLTS